MEIHLRPGTELYSLIVFNASRDAHRRRIVLRDHVIHVCTRAHSRVKIHSHGTDSHMYLYVAHKIPSRLRATCVSREALKAIGIIERNGKGHGCFAQHIHTQVCSNVIRIHRPKATSIEKRRSVLSLGVTVNFATKLCIAPCSSSIWIPAIWRRVTLKLASAAGRRLESL